MKKLAAAATLSAVLCAMAQPTFAAQFTVYGVADAGLAYKSTERNDVKESTFGVISGHGMGSRFGFKGEEDLGNGMKASFRLENGFTMDDGQLAYGGRLFGREARATLSGGFGEISMGHIGGLTSSAGYYDVVFVRGDAFDGGDNSVSTGFAMSARGDNTVVYATPDMGGVKLYAQYSFQMDGQENAHSGQNNRNGALAVTYDAGPLQLVASTDVYLYGYRTEEGLTATVGGNYDFGPVRLYAMLQYADKVASLGGIDKTIFAGLWTGEAAHLGASVPMPGGKVLAALYWAHGKSLDDGVAADTKLDYCAATARYIYNLSDMASLYLGAGFSKSTLKPQDSGEDEDAIKKLQVYTGLTVRF